MENSKKKTNWFLKILLVLFLLYSSLLIAIESGYYEAKLNQKTTLTDEAIKRFEKDVKDGKDVTLTDYVEEQVDYSSNASKLGQVISRGTEKFMGDGINGIANVLKLLFS